MKIYTSVEVGGLEGSEEEIKSVNCGSVNGKIRISGKDICKSSHC